MSQVFELCHLVLDHLHPFGGHQFIRTGHQLGRWRGGRDRLDRRLRCCRACSRWPWRRLLQRFPHGRRASITGASILGGPVLGLADGVAEPAGADHGAGRHQHRDGLFLCRARSAAMFGTTGADGAVTPFPSSDMEIVLFVAVITVIQAIFNHVGHQSDTTFLTDMCRVTSSFCHDGGAGRGVPLLCTRQSTSRGCGRSPTIRVRQAATYSRQSDKHGLSVPAVPAAAGLHDHRL